MKTMTCKKCGRPHKVADDTTGMTCGTCNVLVGFKPPKSPHALLDPGYPLVFTNKEK